RPPGAGRAQEGRRPVPRAGRGLARARPVRRAAHALPALLARARDAPRGERDPRPGRGGAVSGRPRARSAAALLLVVCTLFAATAGAKTLVPMDDQQSDHLKAYGLTFYALTKGERVDWLLNYRGGSFLLPDDPDLVKEANLRGVTTEPC